MASALQDVATERRQRAAAPNTIEQWFAEFFLERLDAATERRLRQEQRFGGPAERSGLCQRDQMTELNECHRRDASVFIGLIVRASTMHWTPCDATPTLRSGVALAAPTVPDSWRLGALRNLQSADRDRARS